MPLELDDREPPEDDPDAPAPVPSVLRSRSAPRLGLNAQGAGEIRARGTAAAGWDVSSSSPTGTTSVSLPATARTCVLMRARREPESRTTAG